MDGLLLFLFIIGAIAIGNFSQKKKSAASSPKRDAPVATVLPVSKPTPVKPTAAPSVTSRTVPTSAKKQEEHADHVHSKHVVAPSFYTGHAHEESSMTGSGLTCASVEVRNTPEKAPDAPDKKLELDFDGDSVVKGLIYAEILGKPKALR